MPDLSISNIRHVEVLDCRGLPTVQVDVVWPAARWAAPTCRRTLHGIQRGARAA